MKISFISKFEPSININVAILLQVQKEDKLFGLESVDPKNIIKKVMKLKNSKALLVLKSNYYLLKVLLFLV